MTSPSTSRGSTSKKTCTFTYSDAQAHKNYAISDFTLTTGTLVPNQPVDLTMSLGLKSGCPCLAGAPDREGQHRRGHQGQARSHRRVAGHAAIGWRGIAQGAGSVSR